jgi:nitrite reductase/ring-hydroxylating ferredoxin subunit
MAEFRKVAKAGDVPPGTGVAVDAGGVPVALFNVDGEFHAIHGTCAHRGGPLGQGTVVGASVLCPWHLWEYEIATGACVNNPDARVARFEVRREGDDLLVRVVDPAPPLDPASRA